MNKKLFIMFFTGGFVLSILFVLLDLLSINNILVNITISLILLIVLYVFSVLFFKKIEKKNNRELESINPNYAHTQLFHDFIKFHSFIISCISILSLYIIDYHRFN